MPAGQTDDTVHIGFGRSFGAWGYPRLVGALVLAGLPPAEAEHHVRSVVRRELKGGLVGGSEAGRLLEEAVLETVRPPASPLVPVGEVGSALAGLPWDDRLATVASLGLGNQRLGAGRPDVIATALGEPDAELSAVVADAVQQHAPAPDPGLIDELRTELRRRRTAFSAMAAVAIVVLAVVAVVLVRRTNDANASRGPTAAADYSIVQWVAVLEYGADAFELYEGVDEIGEVVGEYAFTDAWSCYEGFPRREAREDDDWFLGVAAPERAQLDDLVGRLGRQPLLTARVRQTCVLPPP